jgi:hypothetical protein
MPTACQLRCQSVPTKQVPLCQPCQPRAYKAGLAVGRLAAGVVGHVRA